MCQTNLTWKPENHFHNLDTAYTTKKNPVSTGYNIQVTLE